MTPLLRAAGIVFVLTGAPAFADTPTPPPPAWRLLQNAPNPFCPTEPSGTRIDIEAPQPARVELLVLSSDGTTVLRTLVDQDLVAGFHAVVWDGKDAGGTLLGDGLYPYRLTARTSGGDPLFQDTKTCTLSCVVSTSTATWSLVKSLYE